MGNQKEERLAQGRTGGKEERWPGDALSGRSHSQLLCPAIATTRFHRHFLGGGCAAARLACPSTSFSHTLVRFQLMGLPLLGAAAALALAAGLGAAAVLQKSRTTGCGWAAGWPARPPVKASRPLAALTAAPLADQTV